MCYKSATSSPEAGPMHPTPDASALTPLRRKPTRAETARANGARSRGPFTDVGKARSRSNALKHGLRSAEFGLLPEENADVWEAHLAAVRATYLPQDPVEVHLVEGIAVAQWRELRADRIEADVMCDIRPAFAGRSHGTNFVARDDARAGTGTALRYRTQAQLEVQRAINLLRRHRQDRAAGLIPPLPGDEDGPEPEPTRHFCTNKPGPPAPSEPQRARTTPPCTDEPDAAPGTSSARTNPSALGAPPPHDLEPHLAHRHAHRLPPHPRPPPAPAPAPAAGGGPPRGARGGGLAGW